MFSVFLPVRNGWPYVKDCVESILGQSFPDLELTVLDNQSSDATMRWLKTVNDKRLRVIPSAADLSIAQSWSRIKDCSKREYLTMIGHDDLLDREFLEAIRDLIERHPRASLFQTQGRFINAAGGPIRSCQRVPERESAAEYLAARLELRRDTFGTGFVMRSVDYDRVGGIPPFERLFFADDALWLSLMKGAYKAAHSAEAFSVRIHPKSESASVPSIWRPMLDGLNQFSQFVTRLSQEDQECKDVVDRLWSAFMVNRHQTALAYALLEACRSGHVLSGNSVRLIEQSLERTSPGSAVLLQNTLARMLRIANASPLRRQVTKLWDLVYAFRTR